MGPFARCRIMCNPWGKRTLVCGPRPCPPPHRPCHHLTNTGRRGELGPERAGRNALQVQIVRCMYSESTLVVWCTTSLRRRRLWRARSCFLTRALSRSGSNRCFSATQHLARYRLRQTRSLRLRRDWSILLLLVGHVGEDGHPLLLLEVHVADEDEEGHREGRHQSDHHDGPHWQHFFFVLAH